MKKSKLSGNATKYLLQYSKLSCVFLIIRSGEAASEVVYTDIEPDVILANDDDNYYLDINNDASYDIYFLNIFNTYGGYWTSGSIYYIPFNYRAEIDAFALNSNSLAGINTTFSTYSSGTFQWFLAYALNQDGIIDSALEFQGLIMAVNTLLGPYANDGVGYWFPEVLDHYIGVRFIDNEENSHYGWIRCDVKEEGRTLVIKDYAYESEPDNPIVAGDTVHYIGINSIENTIEATVYSFGRDIYILTETFKNTEVIICDLKGQEVVRKLLHSKNELINMGNNPAGMYLVTLLNEGKRYNKKVFIE